MPPAGPSTFLTDTMSVTRRSDLMSRETSAFGDEKKEKPRLPVIKERSVRHSLPQYNRSATAKRQVRNFEVRGKMKVGHNVEWTENSETRDCKLTQTHQTRSPPSHA